MGPKCCHPLLLWVLHLILSISALLVSVILLLTLLSARPIARQPKQMTLTLTIVEEVSVAHFAFSLVGLVFLNKIMRMVSTGEHRDDFYRVEKDFKILSGLLITTCLVIAICGILAYVYQEEALAFENLPEYAKTAHDINVEKFLYGTSTTSKTLTETRKSNVEIYVIFLLIVDVIGFVLSIVDVIVVVGCNKRERYNVEDAVERAMLARQASRARTMSGIGSRSSRQPVML